MATILTISSQVVRGAVGNAITVPALQRLGHTVWHIPTILLSNHPGHGAFTGRKTDPSEIMAMWQTLAGHGWTSQIDAVLTGYLPDAGTVEAVTQIITELGSKNPNLVYLCDPAIGDEPNGLYIDENAAIALRDNLLPRADITTPNRFELSWLTKTTEATGIQDAVKCAQILNIPTTIVTSVPSREPGVTNVLMSKNEKVYSTTPRRKHAPNGTGDLFAALYLGALMNEATPRNAFGRAIAAVDKTLEMSSTADELQTARAQEHWTDVIAVATKEIEQ